MIVNIITNEDNDDISLIVALTVQDIEQSVTMLHAGSDIVELPTLDLDALLSGTDTPGHVNSLRLVIVRQEGDVDAMIMEDLDGYEGVVTESHGGAEDGIKPGWVSPLRQDIEGELAGLDDAEAFDKLFGDGK